ncbi:hypothetical protein AOQ84DRAFT_363595, partial [Glonium stellatum]
PGGRASWALVGAEGSYELGNRDINEFSNLAALIVRARRFYELGNQLEVAQLDDTDALSPSKPDSGGDDEDATARPTTANTTLRHVHVNAIADYYNIPRLKEFTNTKYKTPTRSRNQLVRRRVS